MRNMFVLALIVAVASAAPLAHHGDADRYNPQVMTVTGTVVEVQMVNPHSHIILDVTDDAGKTVRWTAELGAPQPLIRQFGWTPTIMKAGTKITITGRRLKSGAPYMNLTERANVVLTDSGKEIFRTENFGQPPPAETGRGTGDIVR